MFVFLRIYLGQVHRLRLSSSESRSYSCVTVCLIAWKLPFRNSHVYPVRVYFIQLQSSDATFRQYCFIQVVLNSEPSDYFSLAQLRVSCPIVLQFTSIP